MQNFPENLNSFNAWWFYLVNYIGLYRMSTYTAIKIPILRQMHRVTTNWFGVTKSSTKCTAPIFFTSVGESYISICFLSTTSHVEWCRPWHQITLKMFLDSARSNVCHVCASSLCLFVLISAFVSKRYFEIFV